MSALLRYEIRKTWSTKLILLGICAVLELGFLISLLLSNESSITICALLLFMLSFGGVLFIGFQSVTNLHRDMNTRQGYMLFMTPNNAYRILGAKVLENGLSILIAGAFFALLGFIDINLLFVHYGQLNQLWDTISAFLSRLFPQLALNMDLALSLFFSFLCNWLATVTSAFLADVVASALLRGKKFGGLLAFLLFVLLEAILFWLETRLHSPIDLPRSASLLAVSGVDILFSILLYWLTALIMDRYLSV